jgi:hypothetical protein
MPDTMSAMQIAETFVALDDAGRARPLPVTEDFWAALQSGRLGSLSRLVSFRSYDRDWAAWERHPAGEEFVCLFDGAVELLLDQDGSQTSVLLDKPGAYVLVPPGTWHTAKMRRPSRMIFITPGEGTENRPA